MATEEKPASIATLDEAVHALAAIAQADGLTADTRLLDADIDSLDFVEWLVDLDLVDVGLDDAALYDLLEDGTVRDLYEAIVRAAATA